MKRTGPPVTSHELKLPLTVILGYGEMLEATLTGREKPFIDKIVSQTLRLKQLIEMFFDIARLEHGKEKIQKFVLCVIDQGPGIPQEARDQIFQKFNRGKKTSEQEGFGLGLNFVQEVIRRHGGELYLDSQVKTGACFCFTLPKHMLKNNIGSSTTKTGLYNQPAFINRSRCSSCIYLCHLFKQRWLTTYSSVQRLTGNTQQRSSNTLIALGQPQSLDNQLLLTFLECWKMSVFTD
jgi:hypothetical protein